MNIEKRIEAFAKLGNDIENIIKIIQNKDNLKNEYSSYVELIRTEHIYNPWFTQDNIIKALNSIRENLIEEDLTKWIKPYYTELQNGKIQNVAVIMAGNIPLVSFHDILSVLITGNKLIAKVSSQDKNLPIMIFDLLYKINPQFKSLISIENRLSNYDKVIATGSNNSSRYFDFYFGKKPIILRKHRNSIAVINGNETKEELSLLGNDLFTYFGLGCRNVSKIYIPEFYDINNILNNILEHSEIVNHNKYGNNYDYYKTIFMMNSLEIIDNGFVLFKKDDSIHTPVAVVNYQYYENIEEVSNIIMKNIEQIQCVVNQNNIFANSVRFGQTQNPKLHDYSDAINTLEFLLN
ncbi:MAG: hypothetical protein A2X12_09550 [Bacteroidetes bacterium GWE2_29_8]|nr:MAG: hypothetical protein A2X12_09550 [Bacteroidetes bacterium GWE2_29_8]OFY17746.1 MAG: hypothetical protein A2X02_03670 [Bacteroidetes bacterium GWF2_29_10]